LWWWLIVPGVPSLNPDFEVLRHVLCGVPEGIDETAHVVDGATERVDIIVRVAVGIWWWHFLFGFSPTSSTFSYSSSSSSGVVHV
jgi:hypothetical protein